MFKAQRAAFESDRELLEQQQSHLVASVDELERQNAELRQVAHRLHQSSLNDLDTAAKNTSANNDEFLKKLRPVSQASKQRQHAHSNASVAADALDPHELSALARGAAQLNATVSRLAQEKMALANKLRSLITAFEQFDVNKQVSGHVAMSA
jgi:hypothetical protein